MPQNDSHSHLANSKRYFVPASSVTPAARAAGEPNVQHDEPDQPDEPQTHTSCCHRQTSGEGIVFFINKLLYIFLIFVQESPEPVLEPSLASASDDNIAASDSEENELVIDQPMDFSNTASTPLQKVHTFYTYLQIFFLQVKIFCCIKYF